MKTSARTRANRANAQRSTGPKSSGGKSRVGKNALRHGLAIPVSCDPTLAPEIEHIAGIIAGADAGLARQERARRVAEAQIDLTRIRRARLALLDDPSARIKPEKKPEERRPRSYAYDPIARRVFVVAIAAKKEVVDFDSELEQEMNEIARRQPADGVFPSLAEGLDVLAPKLARLDRYERRALSRRRRAIKELDALPFEGQGA